MRDEQALGVRTVAEAHRRDPDKTTRFFVLVLQRQQRERAVAQWVQHYVARQDPRALAPEFRVVLDATTTGLFGNAAASLIAATVRTWTPACGVRHERGTRSWTASPGTRSTAGWFYVDQLWVDADKRGTGLGEDERAGPDRGGPGSSGVGPPERDETPGKTVCNAIT